jgi:hypothetical protein
MKAGYLSGITKSCEPKANETGSDGWGSKSGGPPPEDRPLPELTL